MAITSIGTLGTGAEGGSSDTSFTLTTGAQLDAGNEGILVVVTDNNGATGETNHHSSVTDSNSNTYTKLKEYTYSPGSVALDGVTVSIWRVRPGSNLAASSTVTITLANNATDKCASFWEFSSGAALELAGTAQFGGANEAHPQSLTLGSLTSGEYLFVRAVGKEINSTTALTATTNFTAIDGTRSRNNSAAVLVRGEFRILTGTTATSAPTINVVCDTVSAMIALKEAAGGTAHTKSVAGTVTSAGAIAKQGRKVFTGALTSAGGLVRMTGKRAAGTVSSAGGVVRSIRKVLAGTLTSAGALTRQARKVVGGMLTSAGALVGVRTLLKAVGGTLTSAGGLARMTGKRAAGTVSSAGGVVRSIRKVLAGTLTGAGGVVKSVRKALAGALSWAGGLAATLAGVFTGIDNLRVGGDGAARLGMGDVENSVRNEDTELHL